MSELRNLLYLKAFGYEFIEKEKELKALSADYDDLCAKVENCTLCVLSKKRKCHIMQNQNKAYKLMLVQNNISKAENENKSLLSSKNGQKLLSLIKEVLNLDKNDIYLSYVYKCYNENKDDFFALQCCLPYFFDEWYFVRPKMLLCLGEQCFKNIGFENFKNLRGQILYFHKSIVLTSFDIDFIIKNPSYEQEFIKDLTKLKAFL